MRIENSTHTYTHIQNPGFNWETNENLEYSQTIHLKNTNSDKTSLVNWKNWNENVLLFFGMLTVPSMHINYETDRTFKPRKQMAPASTHGHHAQHAQLQSTVFSMTTSVLSWNCQALFKQHFLAQYPTTDSSSLAQAIDRLLRELMSYSGETGLRLLRYVLLKALRKKTKEKTHQASSPR